MADGDEGGAGDLKPGINCLTQDLGLWMARHPKDRVELRDGIAVVAAPPFALNVDGYPPDEYLGAYPVAEDIRRAVDGGEGG